MSCGAQRPRAGQPLSWEPHPTVQNEYWAQHNRQNLNGIIPCRTPTYYYSPNAPESYGNRVQQPWQFGNSAGQERWRNADNYYAFPQWGANYLRNEAAVGAYVLTKGACVTESGCVDGITANSCPPYQPFFSATKCSDLRKRKDINLVGLQQEGPQEKVLGQDQFIELRKMSNVGLPHDPAYGPWDSLKETWDDLMSNWKYQRPAFNQ